jgi:hypothetical protein
MVGKDVFEPVVVEHRTVLHETGLKSADLEECHPKLRQTADVIGGTLGLLADSSQSKRGNSWLFSLAQAISDLVSSPPGAGCQKILPLLKSFDSQPQISQSRSGSGFAAIPIGPDVGSCPNFLTSGFSSNPGHHGQTFLFQHLDDFWKLARFLI